LRDLNKTIVEQLRLRRKLDGALVGASIRVGNRYVLEGIRPAYLNGKLVEVILIKRSKATVKSVETGLSLGIVPFSCLKNPNPVPA